ncbi:uncharacterized protein TRAVEDRAFT_131785 [Trametes versicolor FP-101664 SS1]|uniref:uncharacterized protein n=1 Tax=Trametes versicolor (strain FP-101664) TaxID=717944 RepID=UPI0004621A15|nr:uncharacterized protein TRAVEDRAFT_131785 [Trametes versicolor FP-101664 SS1]EIW54469.1 hypothetical protein TRAVEDRAFT_131785 [Trametes versicolor FP-101664 SS1]
MSAYGVISSRSLSSLPSTTWKLASKRSGAPKHLTLHHVTLETARALPGLVDYLHRTFADELAGGRTYPQEILPGEVYTREQFDAYYFAADVLVAVLGQPASDSVSAADAPDGSIVSIGFAEAVSGRAWEECLAGCYYVKPNYPGRSSHVSNGRIALPAVLDCASSLLGDERDR